MAIDMVPIHVKVLRGFERTQLMINGYKIRDTPDSGVIDEFQADQLIIRSSLDYNNGEPIADKINDLGSLLFEVINEVNGITYTYRDFVYFNAIPWFPSFSVQALTEDEPIFAARCVPRIFYRTHALQLFSGDPTLPYSKLTFVPTTEWLCAEPFDAYITFHLADFIRNMNMIMNEPYREFVNYLYDNNE
jgi:hypothetical protein